MDAALLKKIFNQLAGVIEEDDEPIPEYAIIGTGYVWLYDPSQKQIIRVPRGIKCYILDNKKDDLGRILVYTASNDVILIEEDEIFYTGFD